MLITKKSHFVQQLRFPSNKEEQESLLNYIEINDCTPSHDQTIRMRKMHDDDTLTDEAIGIIMNEEKPNQMEKIQNYKKAN